MNKFNACLYDEGVEGNIKKSIIHIRDWQECRFKHKRERRSFFGNVSENWSVAQILDRTFYFDVIFGML